MEIRDFFSQLRGTDIDDLRLSNIGRWSVPLRAVVCLVVFALAVTAYYFLRIKDLNVELETAQLREESLKATYAERAFEAANLDAYRLQMKELEIRLNALIEQLPNDTEVPALLEDITDTGLSSGLVFSSIELQPERQDNYYVELPIKFVASGGYHDFATFISGVAGLPRIVTMHDFDIKADRGGLLTMTLNAKTYRYREDLGQIQGGGQ